MSQLQTHDLKDIVAVTPGGDESPGNLVRHVDDKNSFGTVVALDPRKQGFENQPQVTVLWTKDPRLVHVQSVPINAPSRPLRAKWKVSEEEPRIYGDSSFFSRTISHPTRLEGEEEYAPGDLSHEQLEEMKHNCDDITFHSDGSVIVKKTTDTPPDYMREPDGSFRRTYFRR